MKNLIALLLFAATLNFPPAAAQQNQTVAPQEDDSTQRFMEFQRIVSKRIDFLGKTGNALTRMEEARAVALDYPPETKPLEFDLLASFLKDYASNLGNYADAVRYGDFNRRKYSLEPSKGGALAEFKPVSAVEAVAKAAEKAQIVIVNESHHVPQHRAFTVELLKALKKKGYKYFAVEMLVNGADEINKPDDEINRRGYPVKRSSTYGSVEPIAGDMLRTASRLGYTLVPYDAGLTTTGSEARERGSAANIKTRILDKDPNAKILMHVGLDHNSESDKVYRGAKSVAGYLKETFGIDPLTIDQVQMTERSAPEYESPLYRFAAAQYNLTQPTVFQNSKAELWKIPNLGQDITLFSPRSLYRNGRPHWLALGGVRREYVLPADACAAEKHCLVRARLKNESADATPVDQIEARAGQTNALMLPKGEFEIEVEDAKGGKLKNWRVKK